MSEPCEPTPEEVAAAEEKFTRDVVTRGEAVEPDAAGKLPPGATHEVVKPRRGGQGAAADLPTIRRKRFSSF